MTANFWQQSRQQLLQLLLANACALCQRSTAGSLCSSCQQQIQYCQLPTPLQATAMGVPLPGSFIIDAEGRIRWNWVAPLAVVFTPPRPEELLSLLDTLF